MSSLLKNYHWVEFLSMCTVCMCGQTESHPASCFHCDAIQEVSPLNIHADMLTSSDLSTLFQHPVHTKTAVSVLGHA